MSNTYSLQLRHGAEATNFSTREEVISYIDGKLQYGGVGLKPYEPVLFFYGEENAKNTIILVGLPEGKTQGGKTYFIVDTAKLQEEIDESKGSTDEIIEKLNEEIANREKGDEALSEDIKAEAKAREDADSALVEKIEAEATERENEDARLEEEIKFSSDDIQSVIDACGLIYNEKLTDDRVSYVADSHDEVIRDAKSLSDAVDKISKFAIQLGKTLSITTKDTRTVSLTLEENTKDGGKILTADVNIAGTEGLSKKNYDNNIIGQTSEGIYAAASIEPSTTNPNILIFKTSGYIDGQFKVDAYETEVPLTAYKGDNGKNSGITVDVNTDKNVISATLNLSSDKTNILKLEDGEYTVEGLAKNIKYKDTTVAQALTNQNTRIDEIEDIIEDVKSVDIKGSETSTSTTTVEKSVKGDFTVSNDVKLSSDNSIIIANGGLSANVSAEFKTGNSVLEINVGNKVYDIDLSDLAVSVLKSAAYDAQTEELILTFIVGDSEKTIRIPVGTLIHDLEVDDTDTIDLSLKSVSGGPNHLSAELKVDKAHSDNILTITSSGAYVSKAYITEAVKEESEARKESETDLKTLLSDVTKLANENKESIAEEKVRAEKAEKSNADAIAQEIKDARAAEKANADAIVENKGLISDNEKAIDAEVSRAQIAEGKNREAIVAEETRATAAETKNTNAITSEINRATEKENDLLEKIGDNTVKIGENKTAIEKEITTARAAEKANADAISEESNRAKEAENKNAASISDEKLRATAAENQNASNISNEIERAKKAEEDISTNVSSNKAKIDTISTIANENKTAIENEVIRATAKENANATAIENEANRAKDAEAKNASDIATNSANITKANETINTIDKSLTEEITRAKKAEEANTTAIANETERAKVAEATNADAINNETSRAKKAEDDIKTEVSSNKESIIEIDKSLKNEITRAEAAENANATAVTTETKRATEVEKAINEKIAKNTSDIAAISTTVGDIELKKEGDLAYALYVNGTKHGEFTIPQDQFLKSVTYDTTDKSLVFVFNTTSGEQTQKVSVADLVDTYTNGDGILLNGNAFSVDFTKVATVENVNTAIDTENKRAVEKENDLLNSITANANSINEEVVRAKEQENNLSAAIETVNNSINTLSNRVTTNEGSIDTLKTNINTEIVRAKEAESKNSDAITTEVNTARAAEKVNADAIAAEQLRATTAEAKLEKTATELDGKLTNEETNARNAESALNDAITTVANNLNSAKTELTQSIEKKANSADVYTKNEVTEKLADYAKNTDVQEKLDAKLNITDAKNVYSTKESLQEVKDTYATKAELETANTQLDGRITNNETAIDNFGLTYNAATSELVYTDKNGTSVTYKLYSGSLIKSGEFDTKSNSIVLTIENAGIESKITIPVSELLSDISGKIDTNAKDIKAINESLLKLSKSWETQNSSSIELSKTTSGEKDLLTASVKVASSNKQSIQSTKDGLYVSNDLEDYTVVFGADGTISGQDAISRLKEDNDSTKKDLETVKETVKTLNESVKDLSTRVETAEKGLKELKEFIDKAFGEGGVISVMQEEIEKIKVATGYPTYVNEKTMADRLDSIEENVGDKANPKEGSVWYELNNIIDAGTFEL